MTQSESIEFLRKQGYEFSNWIPAQPDAENQPAEGTDWDNQTAVMVKRLGRHGREYREVSPDGSIN